MSRWSNRPRQGGTTGRHRWREPIDDYRQHPGPYQEADRQKQLEAANQSTTFCVMLRVSIQLPRRLPLGHELRRRSTAYQKGTGAGWAPSTRWSLPCELDAWYAASQTGMMPCCLCSFGKRSPGMRPGRGPGPRFSRLMWVPKLEQLGAASA